MNEPSLPPPRDTRGGQLSDTDLESISDRLCADLVERWRRGERVPVEAYFRQHPEIEREISAFELVLTEVVLRQTNGELTPLDEYIWRFPQFEERLRRHFALHEELELSGQTVAGLTAIGGKVPLTVNLPAAIPSVPGYEMLGELGRGGMGVVYRARDIRLGRRVALKFLPTEFVSDPHRLERFLREARTASAMNHPHICTVHALGEYQDRPFIVMEFIDGVTFQKLLERRPMLEETARLFGQAAEALAAAHANGVVHRDVKPENIMLRDDNYVKVLDFGLARRLPTLTDTDQAGSADTDPGTLLGTVGYMSPEQTRGHVADSASDIFSLGIVLYQMVTGRHPFASDSALATLHAIAKTHPVAPSRLNPEVPRGLEQLIEAMLSKDGQLRPTAAQVAVALETLTRPGATRLAKPTLQPIVQRESELESLSRVLEEVAAGSGAMLCLAGEPGIGKSTLVDTFLSGLSQAGRECLIARGQCSERLVGTEAYLPVINALENLLRGDATGSAARLMKVVAPAWYSRLTPHGSAPTISVPTTGAQAAMGPVETYLASSQQAMLREFGNFLREASRLSTVVLFFDDVHWADLSTVDLLAHVGSVCHDMRVLVIVTYRPTEMLLGPHAFHRIKQELAARGVCFELSVGFLQRGDIDRYLGLAFPDHTLPDDFADLIYERTEGSPLFMADLLRYLQSRGVIADSGGKWSLAQGMPDLRQELPASVRSMIERKLERLAPEDRRLLSVASVQGHEFDSAVVAGTLQRDAAEVEERLQVLDNVHGLVRLVRETEFPDRTLTLRYAFVHILYQQTLYDDLQPTRRAALSYALARNLENHHGPGSSTAAAELACLYQVGRDFVRAAQQLHLAALRAAQFFAHQKAVTLAKRGLRLLDTEVDSPECAAAELALQTVLGMQLQVTHGFAAGEARRAYLRARELCRKAPNSVPLFPVLWGLWLYSKVRSELAKAQEMADELLMLARQLCDPDLALQAHQALGMTAFCRGRPAEAVWHVEQASTLYDSERHRTHAFLFGQDPNVMCKSYGAIALWLMGYADQAERQSDEAIQMSREQSPSSQAIALHFAGMLHQLRGEPDRVRECTEASTTIAAEHGFSFWLAGGNVLRGWSLAALGKADEGVAVLRQGLSDWNATESVTYVTYYQGLLAEVLIGQGQYEEACCVLDEALTLAQETGEGLYAAELHRLRGEVLVQKLGPGQADSEVEACFQQALTVAREQQAVGLELRAAISAARLARRQGRCEAARSVLQPVLERMTEGFETSDYLAAVDVLREVGGPG